MKLTRLITPFRLLNLAALGVCLVLFSQVFAACPGNEENDCPGGCLPIIDVDFYACSIHSGKCCQYHYYKWLCSGGGCPDYVLDRYFIYEYNTSTCQANGYCLGFSPP